MYRGCTEDLEDLESLDARAQVYLRRGRSVVSTCPHGMRQTSGLRSSRATLNPEP